MLDMIGQEVNSGDFFLVPGGNARYGGLTLEVGIVLLSDPNFTRLKVAICKLDKPNSLRRTVKTSQKIFKLNTPSKEFLTNESVIKLKELYESVSS
jgi:hypothetical protein